MNLEIKHVWKTNHWRYVKPVLPRGCCTTHHSGLGQKPIHLLGESLLSIEESQSVWGQEAQTSSKRLAVWRSRSGEPRTLIIMDNLAGDHHSISSSCWNGLLRRKNARTQSVIQSWLYSCTLFFVFLTPEGLYWDCNMEVALIIPS